jgi:erythromycin esterase-like protein
VLSRHPIALAWLAGRYVEAARLASDRALAAARRELSGDLPPEPLAEVVEALEREQARLLRARREVALVRQALRGERYVPRL